MRENLVLVLGSREQTQVRLIKLKFCDKYLFVHVKGHTKKSGLPEKEEKIGDLIAMHCLSLN